MEGGGRRGAGEVEADEGELGDGLPRAAGPAFIARGAAVGRRGAEEQIGGGLEGENEEIFTFPGTCSSCGHPSNTLIKKVNIPYFKVGRLCCCPDAFC